MGKIVSCGLCEGTGTVWVGTKADGTPVFDTCHVCNGKGYVVVEDDDD